MIAVGFPGQGGDWNAALRVLGAYQDHPLVVTLRDAIGSERLVPAAQTDVRVSQPAVFVSGLVSADERGLRPGVNGVGAAIGHSLGELTAAAFAGAISPSAGLDLAVRRGELTWDACQQTPGAMVVLGRVDRDEVEWLCRKVQHATGNALDLAVQNTDSQFVVSGSEVSIQSLLELVEGDDGIRARRLPIGGPFHSSLLVGVVEPFAAAAATVTWSPPVVPVVLSTAREAVTTSDELARRLARSLVLPVQWGRALRTLTALNVTAIVDAGPGDTLVRLARLDAGLEVRSLDG